MSQHEKRLGDSHDHSPLATWIESGPSRAEGLEILRLAAARVRASDEATAAIARELNGPLTALLIYLGEIREHGYRFPEADGKRAYLQQVVENALEQTERVCALVKQIAVPQDGFQDDLHGRPAVVPGGAARPGTQPRQVKSAIRAASAMFSSDAGRKPLTKREREVLDLISEGHSNKGGALRMGISPRTFESHRAEAMRKLGARNTADLVRKALLYRDAV
jgi:DNA-binding CsgD family transcriptional regulator